MKHLRSVARTDEGGSAIPLGPEETAGSFQPDECPSGSRLCLGLELTYRHGGRDFRLTDVDGKVLLDVLL